MLEDTPSWILQRQVTEAKSDVAPMRNWGFCISAAIKHFNPYIIQSAHKTCVLTEKNNACMLYKSFAGAHSLQALKWHLSSLQQAVIRLTYNCNISQVPQIFHLTSPTGMAQRATNLRAKFETSLYKCQKPMTKYHKYRNLALTFYN